MIGRWVARYAFGLLLCIVSMPANADDRFLGRWSINPSGCTVRGNTAETTPLVVTETAVAWLPGYCTIKKSYLIGEGLYLQTQCLNDGSNRTMPIGLQLKGKKLVVTWDQTKAGEMQRCR